MRQRQGAFIVRRSVTEFVMKQVTNYRAGTSVVVCSVWLQNVWEIKMAWKAPKIVEVQVGMEINMYACAARK
jgi:coenzyme PQQ precursor peptide PqqA